MSYVAVSVDAVENAAVFVVVVVAVLTVVVDAAVVAFADGVAATEQALIFSFELFSLQ